MNTRIENCSAENGGGVFCGLNTSPKFAHNLIFDCVATADGGGIYCDFNSSPRFTENAIFNCTAGSDGGGVYCAEKATPLIAGNSIYTNSGTRGGGIASWNASPVIIGSMVSFNSATGNGGGISVSGDEVHPPAMISGNWISDNVGSTAGGGIHLSLTSTTVRNNIITGNTAMHRFGGGIACSSNTNVLIDNNTITENSAALGGGGIAGFSGAVMTMVDTILWGNGAIAGKEVSLTAVSAGAIQYCDIEGGPGSISVETGSTIELGEGLIDADPLFVVKAKGAYYLSQIAAGQSVDSPCVAAGDPTGTLLEGTTRTDQAPAASRDMGYHYPGLAYLVVGPGPQADNPPMVRVFPPGFMTTALSEFHAFNPQKYGVNVCCGDVDGDHRDEILAGAGPGEGLGPQVRGFHLDGNQLLGLNFHAYGTKNFGVNVAAGDLDGDGFDEIITGTGPGPGLGAQVRAFDYDGGPEVKPVFGVNFFAYGTPHFGVNVTAGDLDGDGFDEIVTGPGPGGMYGPHVRGWNVDGGPVTLIDGVSFLAYGTQKYGVTVACGDVDGDGIDEIITGPGPGAIFGAHVRGWNVDGGSATLIPEISFFAWPTSDLRYGARVSSGTDLNGNGRDEILVGQGPDPDAGTWIKVFIFDGTETMEWIVIDSFGDLGMTRGANVAAGRF